MGCQRRKTVFYFTEGGQRNIIGIFILPLSGVKVRQRLVSRTLNDAIQEVQYSSVKRKYIKSIWKEFQNLFKRKGALKCCEVRTHFRKLFCPVQVKGKQALIDVLAKVEATIENQLKEGHIEKLGTSTEDFFILPTVVIAKCDETVKEALKSKLINKQI